MGAERKPMELWYTRVYFCSEPGGVGPGGVGADAAIVADKRMMATSQNSAHRPLSGLQTVIPVERSFVEIAFRDERNPRFGQISKERKQLALHANLPDF
jgi:hypothetical protein